MAEITAAMVKELREMTGAGMMDCKKALNETNGNYDEAIEFLRKKGLAAAEKKASRIAAEGVCDTFVSEDRKTAAVVEVNSETDFVAKNEKFRTYVSQVVAQAAKTDAADIDSFLAEPWELDPSKTVNEERSSQIAVIGENLNIRRFVQYKTEGFIADYIHMGGKIAILVDLDAPLNDATLECAKNLAMQIAALNPKYVDQSEVPADFIEHEKAILKEQAMNDPANANKPENIIDKMLIGRLQKEMKEFCLMDQIYVKDQDISVSKYIASVEKEAGCSIKVKRFVRYETGEGLEKKNEDFAAEVAKQMGQ
ncbi:MAG: translation elongation factor Ts [Lachnospiraceae bacterium]|nr:translation elongation factor Ts [Lachnospiraceae bacterium]